MIDMSILNSNSRALGLKLISQILENVGSNDKMTFEDENGYLYSLSQGNLKVLVKREGKPATFFNQNPYTAYNINRYFTINQIPLVLIDSTPQKATDKLTFLCLHHNEVFFRGWNAVKNGQTSCPLCEGFNPPATIDEVKHYVEHESQSGCKLLSTEYKNQNDYLDFECHCGKVFKRQYKVFKYTDSKECPSCSSTQSKPCRTIENGL